MSFHVQYSLFSLGKGVCRSQLVLKVKHDSKFYLVFWQLTDNGKCSWTKSPLLDCTICIFCLASVVLFGGLLLRLCRMFLEQWAPQC